MGLDDALVFVEDHEASDVSSPIEQQHLPFPKDRVAPPGAVRLHIGQVASGSVIRRAIPSKAISAPADKLKASQQHPRWHALPDPFPNRPPVMHGDAGADSVPEYLPA